MNCPRCGNPLPPSAQSCNRCGATRSEFMPGSQGTPSDYVAQAQRLYDQAMSNLPEAQRRYIESNRAAAGLPQDPFGRGGRGPPTPPPPRSAPGPCPKCQTLVPAGARFCSNCASPVS